MKRWMTSLAPNRRTKFVSFTSRLLGKWPSGTRTGHLPAGQVRPQVRQSQVLSELCLKGPCFPCQSFQRPVWPPGCPLQPPERPMCQLQA